jgi:hypothetical protein
MSERIPDPDRVTLLRVRLCEDGPIRMFRGRFAWTLAHLINAGTKGISTIERPAPRWSHYVFRLRRDGVQIETRTEPHGGTYSGHHGVYVLSSPVEVLDVVTADAEAA